MLILDHLAVAATTLAEGTDWVQEQLGVTMQPGGRHERFGTHNMLLGLGDIYLEVIAADPDASPFDGPRWFGLDGFTGPPRLANWICQTEVFDPIAGVPVALTRGDLSWQLTVPDDGSLPYGGAFPTLIQWADNTRHPASRLPDSGCRLILFEVSHPDPLVPDLVQISDPRVRFSTGPQRLAATIETPSGTCVLT